MKTLSIQSLLVACVLTALFALSGCEKKGELEKAGEQMDEALDDMKKKVKDATE